MVQLFAFAKGKRVLIALFFWFAYGFLLFNFGPYFVLQKKAGGVLLEEKFNYNQAEIQKQLDNLQEEGRKSYLNFQLLDGLNATFITIFLTLTLAFVFNRLFSLQNKICLLVFTPVIFGIMELIENTLLFFITFYYPLKINFASNCVVFVTKSKVISGFIVLAILFISLFILGAKTLLSKRYSK